MIAWLVALLIRKGVSSRFAKPLVIAGLVVGAAALAYGSWSLWLYFHDRGVIQNHETAITAELQGRELTSERAANADDARIVRRNRARSEHLERDITNAVTAYPEQSAQSVGPATAAVLDSLRNNVVDPAPADGNDSGGAN